MCACHAAHSSCPFIVTANVSHRMRAKLSPTQSNTAQGNLSHHHCFKGLSSVHQPNKFRLYAQFCLNEWCGKFHFGHRGLETPQISRFVPKNTDAAPSCPQVRIFPVPLLKGAQVQRLLANKCTSFLSLFSNLLFPAKNPFFGTNLEVWWVSRPL